MPLELDAYPHGLNVIPKTEYYIVYGRYTSEKDRFNIDDICELSVLCYLLYFTNCDPQGGEATMRGTSTAHV